MSRRKLKARKKASPVREFRVTPPPMVVQNPHAAGIDVHSDNHVVCVGLDMVDTFGAYTADLHQIVAHLRRQGITTVAMESTGVYWIPLFELLEAEGFEAFLVEPGQLRSLRRPAQNRRSRLPMDSAAARVRVAAGFVPSSRVGAGVAPYHRQRQMLIRYAAGHVQHTQKALTQMNVKLTEVLSDITGRSGLAIIDAILGGERCPDLLAGLASPKCAKTKAEFARALEGLWQPEHLFELEQARALFRYYQGKIDECDQRIALELANLPNRSGNREVPPKTRQRGRKKNDLRFEATGPLFQALGVDLTAIEGIEVGTALVILAEIGVDVSRFPSERHFASWLGLCPKTSTSNQTEKKTSPRKGSGRVKRALRMCAESVGRTMTPLGMFYRRMRSRIGGRGACTATAHKLARLVYRMLKYGTEYVVKGMAEYAAKMRAQAERTLRKKAAALGFELTPKAAPALE